MSFLRHYKFLITFLCLLGLGSANAINKISIDLETAWLTDDTGIRAAGLSLSLELGSDHIALLGKAKRLQLPKPYGELREVSLQCLQFKLATETFNCQRGTLQFQHNELGKQTLSFSLVGNSQQKSYQFSLDNIAVASGKITVAGDLNGKAWTGEVKTDQLAAPMLLALAAQYSGHVMIPSAKAWLSTAMLTGSLILKGNGEQLESAKWQSDWSDITGSDEAGKWVAEAILAKVAGTWSQDTGAWSIRTDINGGQAYGEPIFLDFAEQAVSFVATGKWTEATAELEVDEATFSQAGVMQASLSAVGKLTDWQQATGSLQVSDIDMAALYEIWMQPFMLSNAAGKMSVSGIAQLGLEKVGQDYQMNLVLDNVSAQDEEGRFQLQGLAGNVVWTSMNTPVWSTLYWQGGQLYTIPFGQAVFQMKSTGDHLWLRESANLPILDGVLTISEFALARPLAETTRWSFAAELSPISMPLLSEKLGWPTMSGALSGNIPKVAYQQKQITMDGDLSVNLFAGETVIRDLKLADPFGSLPQLSANIDMEQLDLALLTETFDFGEITGKLDGAIHNLRLANWKPVAFDAEFATPIGDKHRRRISQKAVEHLTEVGGGPSAALSKGFLRFFEDFSYQKMGLSCKLRNNVCEMAGVGDASPGYYIVKGGSLPPRINIVGFTRRVDWADLIARLKAVSESDGPIIE